MFKFLYKIFYLTVSQLDLSQFISGLNKKSCKIDPILMHGIGTNHRVHLDCSYICQKAFHKKDNDFVQ